MAEDAQGMKQIVEAAGVIAAEEVSEVIEAEMAETVPVDKTTKTAAKKAALKKTTTKQAAAKRGTAGKKAAVKKTTSKKKAATKAKKSQKEEKLQENGGENTGYKRLPCIDNDLPVYLL